MWKRLTKHKSVVIVTQHCHTCTCVNIWTWTQLPSHTPTHVSTNNYKGEPVCHANKLPIFASIFTTPLQLGPYSVSVLQFDVQPTRDKSRRFCPRHPNNEKRTTWCVDSKKMLESLNFLHFFSQNQDNIVLLQTILAESWLLCVRSDRETSDYTNRRSKSPTKYAPIADHNRVHKDVHVDQPWPEYAVHF